MAGGYGGAVEEPLVLPTGPPGCGGEKSSGGLLPLVLTELKYFKKSCGEITRSAVERGSGALVAAIAFGTGGGAAGAAGVSVF
jgi:hypothetical protein